MKHLLPNPMSKVIFVCQLGWLAGSAFGGQTINYTRLL